jgi:hypothetical protein
MDNQTASKICEAIGNKASTKSPSDTHQVECLKVLGGSAKLQEAVSLALSGAEILSLITAYELVAYCMDNDVNSEQVAAFKKGQGSIIDFLIRAKSEYDALKSESQPKDAKA